MFWTAAVLSENDEQYKDTTTYLQSNTAIKVSLNSYIQFIVQHWI